MTQTQHVNNLNSMLRGELAATETYQQALDKVAGERGAADLRSIHSDHRETANEFRKHIHHFGGTPDQGSGAWGAVAKAVTSTATVFGTTAALKALKEGEEQGVKSYEKALKEPDWPGECRTLLNSALDRCQTHVRMIDLLMESRA